jgi:hypothetical protein
MVANPFQHPAFIAKSQSNPQQVDAFNDAMKLITDDFDRACDNLGANITLPHVVGIENMIDFSNSDDDARRVYFNERIFKSEEGGLTLDNKVGQTVMSGKDKRDSSMKQLKKYGLISSSYYQIANLDDQSYEAQESIMKRFDETNQSLHRIEGDLSEVTVAQAFDMEFRGLPFLVRYMRKMLTGDGGYVKSVRSHTVLSDFESAATRVLERAEYFDTNLPQHPHEHFDSHIGGVLANEQIVINALSSLMSKFNPAEKRLLKNIMPLMLNAWASDAANQRTLLTEVLTRDILNLELGTHESLPGGGMWLDAFGEMVPMTKAEAKRRGWKSDEIYNDKHFTMIQRKIAMKVIRLIIDHIEKNGGWLFLNRNKAALVAEGGIDMVSFLEQLHDNEDGVGWNVIDRTCFGVVTLRMKTTDDKKICLISVHCPPSAQGPAGPGTNIRILFRSMNNASMSNRYLGHINDILTDPTSDTVQTPTMEEFYVKPLVGNNIFAMLLFVFGSQNCHFPLQDASHFAKASMQLELLSREFNKEGQGSRLISEDSIMIGKNHRTIDINAARYGWGIDYAKRTATQQANCEKMTEQGRKRRAAKNAAKNDELLRQARKTLEKYNKSEFPLECRLDDPNLTVADLKPLFVYIRKFFVPELENGGNGKLARHFIVKELRDHCETDLNEYFVTS